MFFSLTTLSLDDVGIMTIFDVIILICGVYTMYTARRMKKTGVPPSWLLSQQELSRISNPREFCEQMSPKTLLFGIFCGLYGIYGLAETFFIKKYFAEVAGVVIFLMLIVWYVVGLQNAKEKYTGK